MKSLDRSQPRRVLVALAVLAGVAGTSGCRELAYYEKESFSRWTMQVSGGPSELHFHQKIYYSEEGSAGGIGTEAGGGCGCY